MPKLAARYLGNQPPTFINRLKFCIVHVYTLVCRHVHCTDAKKIPVSVTELSMNHSNH